MNHKICRVCSPILSVIVLCRRQFLFVEFIEQTEMVDIDLRPTYQFLSFQKMIDTVSSDRCLSDCRREQMRTDDVAGNEVAWTSGNLKKLIGFDQGSLIAQFFNTGQVATLTNRRDHQISLDLKFRVLNRLWNALLINNALTHSNRGRTTIRTFNQTNRHYAIQYGHPFSEGIIDFFCRCRHLRLVKQSRQRDLRALSHCGHR